MAFRMMLCIFEKSPNMAKRFGGAKFASNSSQLHEQAGKRLTHAGYLAWGVSTETNTGTKVLNQSPN